MSGDHSSREGSLEAPTRHPIDWRAPAFVDETALFDELERVFDICHGCRRCFSLCHAFPTLFDAVDDSESGELDTVPKQAYWDVVDHCYLCDMCYMSKCPYVPPHEWAVDFPHLMLRAKYKKYSEQGASLRDRVLSATDTVGKLAGIPVIAQTINGINASAAGRKLLEGALGVHRDAPVPKYHSQPARRRLRGTADDTADGTAVNGTAGRVVIFTTCYGNRNLPEIVEDLAAVYRHNRIGVTLAHKERCCGMPKLELGDLASVEAYKNDNIGELHKWVADGWDVVAPIPSCVLMFKQELPLLFPEDEAVQRVADAIFDPGQGGLSGALPSPSSKYRLEDPRCAEPGARDQCGGHRALFRPRRHLRREKGISRHREEDCPPGGAARGFCGRGSFHQRLSHGGGTDRGRCRVG
jgi:glycerol-3-phosphate dehydrogenase subunit C